MMKIWDAVIVGGGPAGCSCAIWLKNLGFNPLILEASSRLGGLQAQSPYSNNWIVSNYGNTGHQIAENIGKNCLEFEIQTYLNQKALGITEKNNILQIHTEKDLYNAKYLVVASGVKPTTGGFTPSPNVLIGPGDKVHQTDFKGKSVAILGGGDNAFENYLFIRERLADNVKIYARTIKARKQLLQLADKNDVFVGDYKVDAINYSVANTVYDYIVVLYGWTPNIDWIDSMGLNKMENGDYYLDKDYTTSNPKIYVIGEASKKEHPCCVTSMAQGVVAAKSIQKYLE